MNASPSTAQPWIRDMPRPGLIAMIHVAALPGTPRSCEPVEKIARAAADEARLLHDAGADALMIENMHDLPYLRRRVGPEIVAGMTAVAAAVRAVTDRPLGVQILAGANRAALAVAHATGCQFIRAENFVFAHVADEGLMAEADAGPLLRFRRHIGAEHIAVFADVKKKHAAHAITGDVDLAETAAAAELAGADGVIVTGSATGQPTRPEDVRSVRQRVATLVLVGSGTTPENVAELAPHADAFIVGSYLKRDGRWSHPPDKGRVAEMVRAIRAARR